MEQRPLRLGDIVDDYCPRERRLTNHAIVAIVANTIRQTRCTTCDAEHMYKNGREPRRRKKDDETLFDQVLADVTGGQLVGGRPAAGDDEPASDERVDDETPPVAASASAPPSGSAGGEGPAGLTDETDSPPGHGEHEDGWPAHRQLIRAALPRVDGEPPAPRPIPEFTMYQRQYGRGGRPFRFGGNGQGNGGERNGNVAHPRSEGRSGPGSPGGHPGDGQGPGQGRPGRRHRRRRPR